MLPVRTFDFSERRVLVSYHKPQGVGLNTPIWAYGMAPGLSVSGT